MDRRRRPAGVGPVMREEDFMVERDYGRIHGDNLRTAPSPYQPGDLAPQTLRLEGDRGDEDAASIIRRRRAAPQRMAKGGAVRGDGCARRGKTRGKMC